MFAEKILKNKQTSLTQKKEYIEADKFGKHKDIWGHPVVYDRNKKNHYEVAELMAEFANWYFNEFIGTESI